jgi:vacuolar protein sorting-associated protein 45
LKFKLVLLYSIKYANDKEIKEFLNYLKEINSDQTMLSLINLLGQYQSDHKSDLFQLNNIKKKAKSYFDKMLKDVTNVYTQHKPYLF